LCEVKGGVRCGKLCKRGLSVGDTPLTEVSHTFGCAHSAALTITLRALPRPRVELNVVVSAVPVAIFVIVSAVPVAIFVIVSAVPVAIFVIVSGLAYTV
jgi:hypothetical protein